MAALSLVTGRSFFWGHGVPPTAKRAAYKPHGLEGGSSISHDLPVDFGAELFSNSFKLQ